MGLRRHPKGVVKDFVSVGGMVTSRRDGTRVYADARNLARAHGVAPRRCVLLDVTGLTDRQVKGLEWRVQVAYWFLPVLRPREDGRYVERRKELEGEFGYA